MCDRTPLCNTLPRCLKQGRIAIDAEDRLQQVIGKVELRKTRVQAQRSATDALLVTAHVAYDVDVQLAHMGKKVW